MGAAPRRLAAARADAAPAVAPAGPDFSHALLAPASGLS
jgi:hypothetical protein